MTSNSEWTQISRRMIYIDKRFNVNSPTFSRFVTLTPTQFRIRGTHSIWIIYQYKSFDAKFCVNSELEVKIYFFPRILEKNSFLAIYVSLFEIFYCSELELKFRVKIYPYGSRFKITSSRIADVLKWNLHGYFSMRIGLVL